MSDDRFLIPPRPQPESVEPRPHRFTISMGAAALIVAVAAAGFAAWQGYESHRAITVADRSARAAEQMLRLATLQRLPAFTVDNTRFVRAADSIQFWITLRNFGESRAKKIDYLMTVTLDNRVIARQVPENPAAAMSVGVIQSGTWNLTIKAPIASWKPIEAGSSTLQLRLAVTYENDLDTERRGNSWCQQYVRDDGSLFICTSKPE